MLDESLAGEYKVTLEGRLRDHRQASYYTSFDLTIKDECLKWNYDEAPVLSWDEASY